LKKGRRAPRAAQKLLLLWRRDVAAPMAQMNRSLFGFAGGQPFSSEKEQLP
jgi:hypothetical protein